MFYHDKRLQYPVRVENPDPLYARQLQQERPRLLDADAGR